MRQCTLFFFSTQIYTIYFQIRLFLSKVNDPKLTVNNVNQDSLSFIIRLFSISNQFILNHNLSTDNRDPAIINLKKKKIFRYIDQHCD